MWSPALLGVLVASARQAAAQNDLKLNNTISQQTASSGVAAASRVSGPPSIDSASSKDVSSNLRTPISPPSIARSSTPIQTSFTPTGSSPLITPSSSASTLVNSTQSLKNNASSSVTSSLCTGCFLEAYNPVTTFFDEEDSSNPWTSVVVTETILTQFITYLVGTSIDTIVTDKQTVNQTKTVVGTANETITHTTPTFYFEPTPGVVLTLNAGPTYVLYNSLWGGLDKAEVAATATACNGDVTSLSKWQPSRTEDWSYFIETYAQSAPAVTAYNQPVSLPTGVVQYLQQNLAVQSQYNGSKIATCTLKPTRGVGGFPALPKSSKRPAQPAHPSPMVTEFPPEVPERTTVQATVPVFTQIPKPPASFSVTTGIYLSTTYESTSTHVTRQGCLRCQNLSPTDGPSEPTNKINDPVPDPIQSQYHPVDPNTQPNNPSNPQNTPNAPNNPNNPNPKSNPNENQPGQSITIGTSVVPVRPADPTPTRNPQNPGVQNKPEPGVVVGSQTLTPGQTTTINGVPIIVPSDGGGSRIVVGGTIIAVNPVGAPVITIEEKAVTATVVGGTTAFVFSPSQTLTPGGVITISGSTISMPASASGTVLVINGITSTLNRGPITAAPGLTIDGKTYAATVRDGTTEYVLGTGTTLKPGEAVTVSGTTYSLDRAGTALVVNGKTSTIPNIPASNAATTTRSNSATPSVRDVGNFVWSGLGGGGSSASKGSGASLVAAEGVDKWLEGLVVGAAGWLLMML